MGCACTQESLNNRIAAIKEQISFSQTSESQSMANRISTIGKKTTENQTDRSKEDYYENCFGTTDNSKIERPTSILAEARFRHLHAIFEKIPPPEQRRQ